MGRGGSNCCSNSDKEKVMAEIKLPITKSDEGKSYIAGCDDYIITEEHSLADIVRLLIDLAGGKEDIQYLLDNES